MEQTEGFRGEVRRGMVVGIKGGTYCMAHWVLFKNNNGTLHQKLMMYCMVTNIT